jgi:periplasmic nitrate reductase NapD
VKPVRCDLLLNWVRFQSPCWIPTCVRNAANAHAFAQRTPFAFAPKERKPFMAEIHIASCVVRVRPEAMSAAIAPVETIAGSAVEARDAAGKLVIVLEDSSTGALLDQMDLIRKIPGVLSIEMVYQHAEEESVMKELLP